MTTDDKEAMETATTAAAAAALAVP